MTERKILQNVTIRLDRTQTPPTPHSIRPKEEERLRIFRGVVEVLRLAEIPVAYAYSEPEQSAILGYLRQEPEASDLYNVPDDRTLSIEDRIRLLVRELDILRRDPESLRTDLHGYLQDGGMLLRYAPLIEWLEALEALGRNAQPVRHDDGATYVFPVVVSIEGRDYRIPAMPLEVFRDRVKRISAGQWPGETAEEPEGNPDSSNGQGGVRSKDGSDEEEQGPDSGSDDGKKSSNLELTKLIPVAKGLDGKFYRVPDWLLAEDLPLTLLVIRSKKTRIGSLYDLPDQKIDSFQKHLR